MNKATVVQLIPHQQEVKPVTKRNGRRSTDASMSMADLIEKNKALEARLQTALEMVQQRDQHIVELSGRIQSYLQARHQQEGERLQGWFVSGPSNTSIVFSRSRITDHVLALCAVNGDRVDHYSYRKVTVLIENQHAKETPAA